MQEELQAVTSVYRKPTNTGLLLHHQSHVDNHYKRSLVKTILNRAYRLSSTWELFTTECERLKLIFSNLKYPDSLVNSTITRFVNSVMSPDTRSTPQTENIYRIILPFKDQKSADIVKKHLSHLTNKLDHKLQPVFRSCKIGDDLKVQEPKPPLINQQCVVYNYICDLCDAEYVGYTSRHLYKRIEEHRFTAIGKHLQNEHRVDTVGDLTNNFKILKKCQGMVDCLIHEMLWIRKKKPSLNTQSDSIRASICTGHRGVKFVRNSKYLRRWKRSCKSTWPGAVTVSDSICLQIVPSWDIRRTQCLWALRYVTTI